MENLVMSKSRYVVVIIVLVVGLSLRTVHLSLAQENTSPLGYIVQPSGNTLAFQTLHTGTGNELSVAATQFTEMASNTGETWRYLSLSPNGTWLAGVVEGTNQSVTLAIRNMVNNVNQRISLPSLAGVDTQNSYRLRWSPDSQKVVIEPPNLTLATQIFDLTTQQLHILPTGYLYPLRWLPDSNRFLLDGPSTTGATIYLGEIDATSIDLQPLAVLDREILGLAISRGFTFRAPIYNIAQNRFYVTLAEATDIGPAVEQLYSFDMDGVLRLEANIAAIVDANSREPLRTRIYYSNADSNIYLIVQNNGPSVIGAEPSISLYRLASQQRLEAIYTITFPVIDWLYLTDSQASPDGRYLALGLSSEVADNRGILIIIDLLNGVTVLERNDLAQVCELSWSADSVQVLFSQQLQGGCTRSFDNHPMNQLVAQNVQTLTASVVFEDALTPFFYLPPGG
jgi:hypothetical protein